MPLTNTSLSEMGGSVGERVRVWLELLGRHPAAFFRIVSFVNSQFLWPTVLDERIGEQNINKTIEVEPSLSCLYGIDKD